MTFGQLDPHKQLEVKARLTQVLRPMVIQVITEKVRGENGHNVTAVVRDDGVAFGDPFLLSDCDATSVHVRAEVKGMVDNGSKRELYAAVVVTAEGSTWRPYHLFLEVGRKVIGSFGGRELNLDHLRVPDEDAPQLIADMYRA